MIIKLIDIYYELWIILIHIYEYLCSILFLFYIWLSIFCIKGFKEEFVLFNIIAVGWELFNLLLSVFIFVYVLVDNQRNSGVAVAESNRVDSKSDRQCRVLKLV